MAGAASRP